jgi:hypothetical protein
MMYVDGPWYRKEAGRPLAAALAPGGCRVAAVPVRGQRLPGRDPAVSHDEGVLYQWFLSGPFFQVFGAENGNHHPLHTLLCKITLSLFGMSELSLRIPALLGGLLYFYSVFQLCAFLLGEGFLFLLAVASLSLNPFLLDYLCCARGYSPALGFFLFAVYRLIRYLAPHPDRPARLLNQAGVAIGLSIGSNVIMIFPVLGLTAAFLGMLLVDGWIAIPTPDPENTAAHKPPKRKKERRRASRHTPGAATPSRSLWQALVHYVVPAAAVGGAIAMLPLRLLELEVGYYGPPSLLAILEGIVRPSILHSSSGHLGLAAWIPAEIAIRILTDLAVPAVFLGLVVASGRILYLWVQRRSFDSLPVVDRFLLLLGGMLPLVLLLIVASRYVFEVPYPELRTVLYWIPLLGLACLCLVKRLEDSGSAGRLLGGALAVLLCVGVVQFLTQFNTRYYAEWAYSAATKDMMTVVRAQHAAAPASRVRAGVTWQLEPSLNFYRVMWGLDWLPPIERASPDAANDYYFLAFGDRDLVGRRGLKPLLQDPLSATLLAQAGGISAPR